MMMMYHILLDELLIKYKRIFYDETWSICILYSDVLDNVGGMWLTLRWCKYVEHIASPLR